VREAESILAQIKEKELVKVKVAVASMLRVLEDIGEITPSAHTKAAMRLANAKTVKEIKDSTLNLRPDGN
jgi:hypothetical protein